LLVMRRLLFAVVIFVSACAPKMAPAPVVTAPRFPDFPRPQIPAAYANSPAAANASRGWAFLQAGDLRQAEHEFTAALKVAPAFYPAETSLGYLEIARKDPKAALAHFDRALELHPQHGDVPALVGRGETLLALDRDAEAVTAFEAAIAVDPAQTELVRRVEILKFKGVEQRLGLAREAARAGRLDEAAQAYRTAIASSPDSPFLYRELAGVERQNGKADEALEHFRKAVELDPTDARSLAQIGEIFEARGDYDAAAKAYDDSLAIDRVAAVEAKREAVRARAALAKLPAEYRAIDQAPQINRAELAALIAIRLAPLLQNGSRRGDVALITDVRNNWAATWIVAVAGAGVMEPFANHAFQPRMVVRRTDLAQAVARLLPRVSARNAAGARTWNTARLKFADLSPSHLAYPAASAAVASGVMTTGAGDTFQPSRAVSGAEAIDAIAKLEGLAGLR
jgi:tetratricopeptide (TPR) repeat protein